MSDADKAARVALADILPRIAADGPRSAEAFRHGSLVVKVYAPRGHDPQAVVLTLRNSDSLRKLTSLLDESHRMIAWGQVALGVAHEIKNPLQAMNLNLELAREKIARQGGDVDMTGAQLVVRGTKAKSGRTRYVPLNVDALDVLKAWRPLDAKPEGWVFAGPDGEQMFSLKTAWGKVAEAAKLDGFTFHDLRHSFASKLVQAGVDLNTVRELLGHADIKMTLRYAHLAPEHKAAAVQKLVNA